MGHDWLPDRDPDEARERAEDTAAELAAEDAPREFDHEAHCRLWAKSLSKRQAAVLAWLVAHEHDDDLAFEKGAGWIGYERISARTVWTLMQAMALRSDSHNVPGIGMEHYSINETGRRILALYMGVANA